MKSKLLKGLITLSLSISIIAGGTLLSSKNMVTHASSKIIKTAIVTASNLNFRKSNSTKSPIIGSIKKGVKVQVINLKGDWAYIKYNGRNGYVSKQYLKTPTNIKSIQTKTTQTKKVNKKNTVKPTTKNNKKTTSKHISKATPIKTAYVSASNLNVRSGKGTNYGIRGVLPNGTKVEILQNTGEWSKIRYGNLEGYVARKYLSSNKIYNTTEVNNNNKIHKTTNSNPNITQTDWVSKLKVSNQTSQLVTVQATGTHAVVQFHQKDSKGKWSKVFDVNGYIGYNGLGNPSTRREGDGTTPTGVYSFGQLFGVAPNPGTKLPYTQLTWNHWWVGDSNSKYFNTLQDRRVTGKNWSTDGGEAIIDNPVAYKYGIAINFNMNRKTAYRGWGIHFHCIAGNSHSTAGCVEIPPLAMKEFLQQVDSGAKIVISTPKGIYNY